jgi:hypothetical protein
MSSTTSKLEQQTATPPPHILVANDSADQAMQALQNQWFNVIVAALGLNNQTFQLVEATDPLPNTTKDLSDFFNNIPPASLTQVYSAGGANQFFSDYGGVIKNLRNQDSGQFDSDMGDYSSQWDAYLATKPSPTIPAGGMLALFSQWADMNIPDPGQAATCKSDYVQLQNGIVPTALNAYFGFTPTSGQLFDKTIKDLKDAIVGGASRTISFDSTKASSDVSSAWSQSSSGGLFGLFGSSSSSSSYSAKFSSSNVTIQGTIQKSISFSADPLGWYSSAAMSLAFGTKDNTVWKPGQSPTWETTFGSDGNMQRLTSELVVADGIDMIVTSDASYSSDEQAAMTSSGGFGCWPFYSSHSPSGSESKATFTSSGQMSFPISLPLGNPFILGVNVTPVSQSLAGKFAALQTALLRHR